MIDFRYHLVSLISVFLALSVGIILGAGPLQDAIGNQLQDQVDQLRTERNDLRNQLSAAEGSAADAEEYIVAAGPHLIAGTLLGQRVAIIDLDAVDNGRDQVIEDEFVAAGATVVAHLELGNAWTASADSDQRTRKTVASGLGDLLPEPTGEQTPEQRLAQALVRALTEESDTVPGTLSDTAVELGGQLEELGLVSFAVEPTQPADLVLLISGDTPAPADSAAPTAGSVAAEGAIGIQVDLAVAAQEGAAAALVAGPTAHSGDLISTLRDNGDLAKLISTVSGIEAEPGMINVPLALASRIDGQVGHFGFEDSATAAIPEPVAPQSPTEPNASDPSEG